MKAKQNLELINRDETVIIRGANCNDCVVAFIKDKTLNLQIFKNDNLDSAIRTTYSREYPMNKRHIEFETKLYVVAKEDFNKSALFKIEETANGLEVKKMKRKHLQQNENLLQV